MRTFNRLNLTKSIIGFEGEEDDEDNSSDDGSQEDDDGSKDDDGKQGEDDLEALRGALRKERKLRRDYEKKSKQYEKQTKDRDDQEASDLAKANRRGDEAEAKNERLSKRLATQAVDMAIIQAANQMKFLDIDDATKLVDRELIDVDQDDDDPSDITVDKASVKEALDALAKSKPHLITAHGASDSTGGKFGGSRDRREKDDTKAQAKEDLKRYPALRNTRLES